MLFVFLIMVPPFGFLPLSERSQNHPCHVYIIPSRPIDCKRIYFLSYFNPLHNGIRQSKMIIPTIPITIPRIMLPHTMVKHIPTPRARAPTTPTTAVNTAFPVILIGCLCSIFLHTNTVIRAKTIPTQPTTTPGVKAFHSGSNAMHIPKPKNRQLIIPKIIATKLLFFIFRDRVFENSFLQSARPTLREIRPKISQRSPLRLLISEQISHKL